MTLSPSENENPLVTIICLSFNHRSFVKEALDSVANQSYGNIQIIICDDGSTDGSAEEIQNWLQNHQEVTFLYDGLNRGNVKRLNQCMAMAQGQFFMDFATDDILEPKAIETLVHHFQKNREQNPGVVYANAHTMDVQGNILGTIFGQANEQPFEGNIFRPLMEKKMNVCSSTALYLHELYTDLGGYDEQFLYEDLDFWIRAARKYRFLYCDTVVLRKRIVPHSLGESFFKKFSARAHRMNESTYQILKKALRENESREMNLMSLGRIRYEWRKVIRNLDVVLSLKYTLLYLKCLLSKLN